MSTQSTVAVGGRAPLALRYSRTLELKVCPSLIQKRTFDHSDILSLPLGGEASGYSRMIQGLLGCETYDTRGKEPRRLEAVQSSAGSSDWTDRFG